MRTPVVPVAQSRDLTGEHAIAPKIVDARRQRGTVRGERDRGQRSSGLFESDRYLRRDMLRIGGAAAVAAEKDFFSRPKRADDRLRRESDLIIERAGQSGDAKMLVEGSREQTGSRRRRVNVCVHGLLQFLRDGNCVSRDAARQVATPIRNDPERPDGDERRIEPAPSPEDDANRDRASMPANIPDKSGMPRRDIGGDVDDARVPFLPSRQGFNFRPLQHRREALHVDGATGVKAALRQFIF